MNSKKIFLNLLMFTSLLSVLNCSAKSSANVIEGKTVDHTEWSTLLKKHVSESGKVDYKGFLSDKKELGNYLQLLLKTNAAELPEKERLAFWINAYNAFTVDVILRNYPVKSIKDIRNAKSLVAKATGDSQVWVENLPYKFYGNEALSLANIENQKLLKDLFDPRIHFAINCASFSCPALDNEAYTGAKIENQLEKAAKTFLSDKTKNKISANSVELSSIFDWYKKDFTKKSDLITFLNKYASTKINTDAKIGYLKYNWSLNE